MNELARAAWRTVWSNKRFWLLPLGLALLIVALLVALGEVDPLAPFVY